MLSLGDAYLQHHKAVYQASLGWQESPEYLLGHSLLAKHGLPPGLSLPQLAEVVWPGAQVCLTCCSATMQAPAFHPSVTWHVCHGLARLWGMHDQNFAGMQRQSKEEF